MNLTPEILMEWDIYERDLKTIISYTSRRIELLEHNQIPNSTLLTELKGVQYCMEINSFSGYFKDKLDEMIKAKEIKESREDTKTIIKELKDCHI